ncbi:interferon-induced transmembrane protein 3-like [Ranitomeya variabilis]|uniref:interferon-induced transmembrane protein 3-like n=1 Tax=Ranitomeya variabilis TaxID=490064 RepID=UPI004056E57D
MYPPPPYTKHGNQDQPYQPGLINQPPPPYHTPPGPMPTQPHGHLTVVTTAQYVVAMPQAAYRDYTGLSLLNITLCCLPLGIVAFIFSSKSREALSRGDLPLAAHYSGTALRLNMAGIVLGSCGHLAWITYVIYYIVTRHQSFPHMWVG